MKAKEYMLNRLLTIGLTAVLFFLIHTSAIAAPRFEYTLEAKQAYQKTMSLRFVEARTILDWMKMNDGENKVIYHIENYIDFFTIFINEDKAEFDSLEKNKNLRLREIQAGPEDSPYYLFLQAEVRLQWALARLKFEEYVVAFNEVSKAYKQLQENQKKFPDFIGNKKSLGILHALLGTIPDSYKWGVKILGGMGGTIEQGRLEIEEVLNYATNNDYLFKEETIVMYSWLLLHLKNQEEEAWELVKKANLQADKNPLACFTLANVAMHTGRNETAIRYLENRPKGAVFHPFYYLDYMLGLAKLYRLDKDANLYMKRYINNYRGQNYIKETYQKLAWYHLLQGNEQGYSIHMNYCKNQGSSIVDEDKTALQEAIEGKTPDKILLKARVLFDGGYYERAYKVLNKETANRFAVEEHRIEYTYRLGRITHKLQEFDKAIEYYQQTIDQGQNKDYFYACNAALQTGIIYEKMFLYAKADEYYNLCLRMKPLEYRNSLHQKAKAGRNRIRTLSD